MISRTRIGEEFRRLTEFDSESFHEQKIAEYLKEELVSLGLAVEQDEAAEELMREHGNGVSNIYARLKGNVPGGTRLFSGHMDTVAPGIGKKAVFHEDGTITSDGTTVLGADDISCLVSLLEALRVIKEEKMPHPDLEILITSAEEPFCEGSRFLEPQRLRAKEGYVLDLTGPVGTAALAAPSILSVTVDITGRAAHAGFAPEKGINALSIAAAALSGLPVGRIDPVTTVNFGMISGGRGKNIVPERVRIEGEIRSLNPEKAESEAGRIKEVFAAAASRYGGSAEVTVMENIHAYGIDEKDPVVERFDRAAGLLDLVPAHVDTFGGSDANRLNRLGIRTIVLACGMENAHSLQEYSSLQELERSAQLALKLMTMQE